MKLLKSLKGFTMIELLIVIAVLGILAVAVLSAINPIEQINRGKDTGTRSDAEQLISASDRYYAGKGYYPWMSSVNSLNTPTDPTGTKSTKITVPLDSLTVTVGKDAQQMLSILSTGGASELKGSFTSRITDTANANTLSIYNSGVSGESTYVCFVPKSASFREEAWKRCASSLNTLNPTLPSDFPSTTACPAGSTCLGASTADAATGCYICLP